MNQNQTDLLQAVADQNQGTVRNTLKQIDKDLTGNNSNRSVSHDDVELFFTKLLRATSEHTECDAEFIYYLSDAGISRLSVWCRINKDGSVQLHLDTIKPNTSQKVNLVFDRLGYTNDWLPLPPPSNKKITPFGWKKRGLFSFR